MAINDDQYRTALSPLLAFPVGMDALQGVLSDRQTMLLSKASRAALEACYDRAMAPKALELHGRAKEASYLLETLLDLRRSTHES